MDQLSHVFFVFLHLNVYLASFANTYGTWLYLLLFIIIFCETGLVIAPFLPGDSLLFAAGSIAALGKLNIHLLAILLIIAAIGGNVLNYSIGRFLGTSFFEKRNFRFFNQKHLDQTHAFYEKHGGKALIIGRFLPIIRSFVPFVAGLGKMSWEKFTLYNVIGSFLWISVFLYTSYFFGNIPLVKQHFSFIVIMIIAISIIPALITFFRKEDSSPPV